jgi:microcompartment protein CcmL/EutN
MQPAILLLEFESIAIGIVAGDAMVKRAMLTTLHTGSVQPGKYLVLAGGEVGHVEEARAAGREHGASALIGEIYLPEVHPEVVEAVTGARRPGTGAALGVVETKTVASVIGVADAGIKAAEVGILQICMADGLGGKGYVLFSGEVHNVQAAVDSGVASLASTELLVARVVIPQIHGEMLDNLLAEADFLGRARSYEPSTRS